MSKERDNISVVSTYATDRLIDASTMRTIKEQRGGPVLYIIRALNNLGIEPQIFVGDDMLVEILIKQDDEFGKIHEPAHIRPLPSINTSSTIVSTLLNEWSLNNAVSQTGKLFVDIQGYVRDGSSFGKKKEWSEIEELAPFIFCIKGNEVEVNMLPQSVINGQSQNRMLVVTKGKGGVEIHYQNQSYIFVPSEIPNPPNTIGAGDTWFANYVYKFMETGNVEVSATFAIDQTVKFLQKI
ncbi:hypothetical protein C4564_00425 [Candidatus Microgenomates bacterium]|nr:MAG: hypothetical protein C4564_00425 [Candidatus Microgenomates bacterium]